MRTLLLLLVIATATAAPANTEFDARVWKFQHHWDKFLRGYWGCTAADTSRNTCNATLSTMDNREYAAARKAAAALFDLKD